MHFLIPFLRTEMVSGSSSQGKREGGRGSGAKRWRRRSNEKNLGIGTAVEWTHSHTRTTRKDNRSAIGRRRSTLSNIKRDRQKAYGSREGIREEPDGYGLLARTLWTDGAHFSVKVTTNR